MKAGLMRRSEQSQLPFSPPLEGRKREREGRKEEWSSPRDRFADSDQEVLSLLGQRTEPFKDDGSLLVDPERSRSMIWLQPQISQVVGKELAQEISFSSSSSSSSTAFSVLIDVP